MLIAGVMRVSFTALATEHKFYFLFYRQDIALSFVHAHFTNLS